MTHLNRLYDHVTRTLAGRMHSIITSDALEILLNNNDIKLQKSLRRLLRFNGKHRRQCLELCRKLYLFVRVLINRKINRKIAEMPEAKLPSFLVWITTVFGAYHQRYVIPKQTQWPTIDQLVTARMNALNPAAEPFEPYPVADGELTDAILNLLREAPTWKQVKKGAKEASKTLTRRLCEFIVMAADTEPLDILDQLTRLAVDEVVTLLYSVANCTVLLN